MLTQTSAIPARDAEVSPVSRPLCNLVLGGSGVGAFVFMLGRRVLTGTATLSLDTLTGFVGEWLLTWVLFAAVIGLPVAAAVEAGGWLRRR